MTTTRGTTNSNLRGNTEDRRKRREWLVSTYAADRPAIVQRYLGALHRDDLSQPRVGVPRDNALPVDSYQWQQLLDTLDDQTLEYVVVPACRCYRCGRLLHNGVLLPSGFEVPPTVTVDRIVPGCKGGTYRRSNIRPACGPCNSETGGPLARRPKSTGAPASVTAASTR